MPAAVHDDTMLSVPDEGARRQILDRLDRLRDELSAEEIKRAIPEECFRIRPWRAWAALISSLALLGGSLAALALLPWWTWPVGWFFAGTAMWGLFVVGHDCGHGSFSDHRRLNFFVGHLSLLPILFPFHSWRLQHNHHHANTLRLDQDIDWVPFPATIYTRQNARQQRIYRSLRTRLWWLAVVRDWISRPFKPQNYREGQDQKYVRFSIAVTIAFAVVAIPTTIWWVGWQGLLIYWVAPWFVAYGWFSLVTLLHHTHPEVPYLDKRRWSKAASGLALTVYCRFPRWLEFIMHDINVHVPHHVSSQIPFYHLRGAHRALAERWPELVRETRLTPGYLLDILHRCHLYDRKSGGFYLPFAAVQASNVETT